MKGIAVQIQCPKCRDAKALIVTASSTGQQTCSACGHVLFTSHPILGYIYVLSNPRMPGLLKIGFTSRSIDERVQELNSATGIPAPFVVEAFFPSSSPDQDEQAVYQGLGSHRVERREFVELALEDALARIEATLKFAPLYRRTAPRQTRKDQSPFISMFCGPCKYQWKVDGPLVPHRCPMCHSLSISVNSRWP